LNRQDAKNAKVFHHRGTEDTEKFDQIPSVISVSLWFEFFLGVLGVLAVHIFFAVPAMAQDVVSTPPPNVTISDDQVMAVARSLYCPVCPNEPLDTCQTQACYQWREDIRARLAAGQTREEIIAAFVAQYGEHASAVPLDSGLRGLALYTPFFLALVAILIAGVVIWRWRTTRPPAPASDTATLSTDNADEYRARLEEDLK